jgi:hypothetical protein
VRNTEWNEVHDLVVAAGTALFAQVGIAAEYVGALPHRDVRWSETVSIIGLGGAKLRGALVLSIPAALLRRSHPTRGTDAADLADWLAELANLLLGRVKARLVTRDLAVELAIPITLSATDLSFARFSSTPVVHEFRVGETPIYIVFECVAQEGASLLTPAREDAAMEAGEMVLF